MEDGSIILHARSGCRCCGGRGWVRESHGEETACDCAFESVDGDRSILEAVDDVKYTVLAAPDYMARQPDHDEEATDE